MQLELSTCQLNISAIDNQLTHNSFVPCEFDAWQLAAQQPDIEVVVLLIDY